MDNSVLDTINLRELGRELQVARKRSGFTQEEAARFIEAARTTLTAIEKGERRIKAGELIKLARAYGREVSDFVRPRPRVEPFSAPFALQFRGPNARTEQDNEAIQPVIEEFEELCRYYMELEELLKAPLQRKYPPEYDVRGLRTEQAAESVALEERNRLALGDGPIPQLREILENDVGIRIFYLNMPGRFSEIYRFDDVLGACMCINIGHPSDRQLWSIGHGYAHFLAHRHKPEELYDEGSVQRKPESERFADYFAKHFLMPSSGLVRRFNDLRRTKDQIGELITTADLLTLSHYYGVSFTALMDRLEMGLVPPGTGERMRRRGLRVREAQELLGFTSKSEAAPRVPKRYRHLAFLALERGLITEARFAKFLGVSIIEARQTARILADQTEGAIHSMTLDGNSGIRTQDETHDREV